MTQEQNTATSAEEYLDDNCTTIGKITYLPIHKSRVYADMRIASKLKELSEKGEPTEEEIREICWTDDMKAVVDCDPRAIASGAMIQLRDRLSPVIAALRAENKEMKKHISTCESDHVNTDELLSEFDRRGINTFDWDGDEGAESAIVDGVERYVQTKDEEIASLRAQLETEPSEFAKWASLNQWKFIPNTGDLWYQQSHLSEYMGKPQSTAELLIIFRASKGGKAHE